VGRLSEAALPRVGRDGSPSCPQLDDAALPRLAPYPGPFFGVIYQAGSDGVVQDVIGLRTFAFAGTQSVIEPSALPFDSTLSLVHLFQSLMTRDIDCSGEKDISACR